MHAAQWRSFQWGTKVVVCLMSPVISCSVDLIELLRCIEWEKAKLTNKPVKNGLVKAFALQPFCSFCNCSVIGVSFPLSVPFLSSMEGRCIQTRKEGVLPEGAQKTP